MKSHIPCCLFDVVAIMRMAGRNFTSPFHLSHRMGTVANFKDQYQTDYSKGFREEETLLLPLLRKRQEAIDEIRAVLGDPVIGKDPVTGMLLLSLFMCSLFMCYSL
jgi:hypothetical protein